MMKDKKVLAGGGVLLLALFWFYIKPNYVDAKPPPPPPSEEEIAAAPKPTLTIPGKGEEPLILNLKSTGTGQAYAKVEIALEFEDPDLEFLGVSGHALVLKNEEFASHMETEVHRIRDAISRVIGAKTLAEVSTVEGREALKEELIEAINEEMHTHHVASVYFSSFVTDGQ
ncbi:MAG: flagellar basal body-associated FliL family protein [Dehalococcoidia bacterium]|nr:flagellar basal body-associated FliL family protein [Dehalococcoidia bacterium]